MLILFCERSGSGLMEEPVNVITNIVFLIAARAAWTVAKKNDKLTSAIIVLISLLAATGVGSILYHLFANQWSKLSDLIPNVLFQILFLWLYCRQVARLKLYYTTGLIIILIVSIILSRTLEYNLNNSLMYLPGLLFLAGLGIYHYYSNKNGRKLMLMASVLFFISLTFRTIDIMICPIVPFGTHFIWHILNGWLMYYLLKALIIN